MLTLMLFTAICADPDPKAEELVPKNFVEYFARADAVKAAWIKKTDKEIELVKIGINSVDAKEKVRLKSRLSQLEEDLKSFKKMKPIAGIKPLEEGSIGVFEVLTVDASTGGNVIGVIDKNTIVAEGALSTKRNYFAVLKINSTRGITTKTRIGIFSIKDVWKEKPDVWVVNSLEGIEDAKVATLLRAYGRQSAPILEIVDQQVLEKYRAAYDAMKKPKPEQPIALDIPVAMEPITDEIRSYFDRANAAHSKTAASIEKKIAGLKTAISDRETLPVDKKKLEQELILVRAKLTSLERAKPSAHLRNNPAIGELGTLDAARVVAVHDAQSVVASVADIYGVRLSEIDAKSLKMRVGVTIGEDVVWQVVAVDEKPSSAVADSLKAKKLIVVKPVDMIELEKHRAAYEAAVMAP